MKIKLNEKEAFDFCCEDVSKEVQEIIIISFGQTITIRKLSHWNLSISYSEDIYANDSFGTLEEMINRAKVLLS